MKISFMIKKNTHFSVEAAQTSDPEASEAISALAS